jgi:hypothetical protein
MASQPLETPGAVALQHARRNSESAWGKGAGPTQGVDPRGASAHTNIGSHERLGPSPAKEAMREAGKRGLPAPNGPKGMNAPPARKQPTLPRGR